MAPIPDSPYGLCGRKATLEYKELCESQGGHPGLPVPNSPYGLCGRQATLEYQSHRAQELCESGGGRPGLPVPSSPYGLYGRKATLNLNPSWQPRNWGRGRVCIALHSQHQNDCEVR